MAKANSTTNTSFQLGLWPTVAVGTGVTVTFYGLLLAGPLDYSLLRRYCLSHPVAIATLWLFFLSTVLLARKVLQVKAQQARLARGNSCLSKLLDTTESSDPIEAIRIVKEAWDQKAAGGSCGWYGKRISDLLDRQLRRGHARQMEADIEASNTLDGDRHHDSYAMLRIATWAMPMLGFLGTVLGISDTLGRMDMQSLAGGSQDALNRMTSGLYVAFDTTAIALALTMVTMLFQFVVHRTETQFLSRMDATTTDALMLRFGHVEEVPVARTSDEIVQRLVDQLGTLVSNVVTQQAELWNRALTEARSYWMESTVVATSEAQRALSEAIQISLERFANHVDQSHQNNAEMIDRRWQQWQTTFSEQARFLKTQQEDLAHQESLLCELIEKQSDLREVEATLASRIQDLVDVDRFHHAAICMTEGVAALATLIERQSPRQSPRRHPRELDENHDTNRRRAA